jgi:putative transposase
MHTKEWPITIMCKVLEVSRSGFYAWRKRSESQRSKRQRQLVTTMKTIHGDRNMKSYGSPRMHRELVARGETCSENTVARLMRVNEIRSVTAKKFRATTDSTHKNPVAENVLNREFEQETPDKVWLSDITYLWTGEGWLYLACVLDACSRKIVGWSMSRRLKKELVLDALRMALCHRRPDRERSLLHHSDRGSQYASDAYRKLLRDEKIVCSMSRKGNCWDNAPMESFFATLKKELVHQEFYATRGEARRSVFRYIETFYNRVRRHSALNYLSPDQYEEAA